MSLQERDLKALWHPCSQMKDYESFPPVEITSAKGSILHSSGGDLIDIISSWWCKSLGHGHPEILSSVKAQMDKFEHVILANTTNTLIVDLCEKILKACPSYDKVFFCDSGSDSVEVAMKMSLQYHLQTGHSERKKFLSLQNGYHGETILTLAAGDCGLYGAPFESLMPKIDKIENLPYVNSETNDLESSWARIEPFLDEHVKSLAGIVVEPILQVAGGMLIYDPKLLVRLEKWCNENGVHLIADEILTGMGRLGYARACEAVNVQPHFSVFSKGLTAGFSPLACVLTTDDIYEVFYDEYESGKAFMHSNTYCGNAIGAAAAVAAFKIYEEEKTFERVRQDSHLLDDSLKEVGEATGFLHNYRSMGFVAAADIKPEVVQGSDTKRLGYKVYQEAVKNGLLLRPLGNTIYLLPPLNTPKALIEKSTSIIIDTMKSVLK
ncbi:MAG: adenosylmethionine--8-amino-7-oxononanoate transaminase [Lentisphaeraceae bacterium]|nr:adenosylmethionine--8-amino-7-oxononanoate transaminase [Lentisphaeraceae bacterium]